VPYLGALVSGPPVGIGILSAGIILAIMIIPFIASVMRDVFEVTPALLKESAYGLGATTWEVVWQVVLPYTKTGVLGGIMLGLGRALGETMAVTFVIGNMNQLIRCRCSRRPTASPRRWPTSLPKPARACTRPR
jgi:phosphate transport system permease protein